MSSQNLPTAGLPDFVCDLLASISHGVPLDTESLRRQAEALVDQNSEEIRLTAQDEPIEGELSELLMLSDMCSVTLEEVESAMDIRDPAAVSDAFAAHEEAGASLMQFIHKDIREHNAWHVCAYMDHFGRDILTPDPVLDAARLSLTLDIKDRTARLCLLSALVIRADAPIPPAELPAAVQARVIAQFEALSGLPRAHTVEVLPHLLTPSQVYGLDLVQVRDLCEKKTPPSWATALARDEQDFTRPEGTLDSNLRFLAMFVTLDVGDLAVLEENLLNNPTSIAQWDKLSTLVGGPEQESVVLFSPCHYFNAVNRSQVNCLLASFLGAMQKQGVFKNERARHINHSFHLHADHQTVREVRINVLSKHRSPLAVFSFSPSRPIFLSVLKESLEQVLSASRLCPVEPASLAEPMPGKAFNGEHWVRSPTPIQVSVGG
ncbi:MAG: hypothetical protein Q8N17_00485 [Burkholderiaceae bacterium]|nr:hypothetical protein [Burkholderiaceae bacterium]